MTDDVRRRTGESLPVRLVRDYPKPVLFFVLVLCGAGIYSGWTMPSAVFPQTDFPRVVILVDSGVMPADEMMATVTRPIEEAMKDIPGSVNIRSTTGRGSAAINVFFDWSTDMTEAEQYVLARLSQIQRRLPPSARLEVHRLTFRAFPILGVSLTSDSLGPTELWELGRYQIYPRLLRVRGIARVKLVGGRVPEFHVVVDAEALDAHDLTMADVSRTLSETNVLTAAGMHEENHQLYLTTVDNRLRNEAQIADAIVSWTGGAPVRIRDVAHVEPGAAPQFNLVTADGKEAVLFNIYSQPGGNTVQIAADLEDALHALEKELPPDVHLAFFYDQSLFVREGVRSVWEAIWLGLLLSIGVLYVFLRSWRATIAAVAVIPVTVLLTLIGIRLLGMSFNLMTLGGIAAVVGIVIDDAIVVVEAIFARVEAGERPREATARALEEVGSALVGSTLTPVVVFVPLAFLDGVAGVFFRALATTMVIALLCSLVLAVTWTPVTTALLVRSRLRDGRDRAGRLLEQMTDRYGRLMSRVLAKPMGAALGVAVVVVVGLFLYGRLETDFLPALDEGAFVIDYFSRPGTSLTETNRMLTTVEDILRSTPEVESFSRRTGARLALAVAEPNTGDFLVKLKPDRKRTTEEVIAKLRAEVNAAMPALQFEFPGVLADLIGDLTWSPSPVEIKIFSTDTELLKAKATEIAGMIEKIPGVVDVNDGLIVAGPTLRLEVEPTAAARMGLTPRALGTDIQTALIGTVSSYVLQGDRTYDVRVLGEPQTLETQRSLLEMPLRTKSGADITVGDVVRVEHEPGILEMHREDLRQLVAVSARLEGIDLGSGIRQIKERLAREVTLPANASLEFGGLYEQQQESFRNLTLVLLMALVLVLGVLLLEFRSFLAPAAILIGSVLAMSGVAASLWVTSASLNIISFLGAIIGVGITAKNGILMLDRVDQLVAEGMSLARAVVQSGRRRLRPVFMTSFTTFLGLLPLAYGVGAGADMLRPMAVAVIGALLLSLPLSLVVTPAIYLGLARAVDRGGAGLGGDSGPEAEGVPT